MANKQRGEMTIEIMGEEYTLRPTFEALCEIEDRLDMPLYLLLSSLQSGDIRSKTIATIMWAGYHGYKDGDFSPHAEPSLSEMGNILREHGITKLLEVDETGANVLIRFISKALIGDEEYAKRGKPETSQAEDVVEKAKEARKKAHHK